MQGPWAAPPRRPAHGARHTCELAHGAEGLARQLGRAALLLDGLEPHHAVGHAHLPGGCCHRGVGTVGCVFWGGGVQVLVPAVVVDQAPPHLGGGCSKPRAPSPPPPLLHHHTTHTHPPHPPTLHSPKHSSSAWSRALRGLPWHWDDCAEGRGNTMREVPAPPHWSYGAIGHGGRGFVVDGWVHSRDPRDAPTHRMLRRSPREHASPCGPAEGVEAPPVPHNPVVSTVAPYLCYMQGMCCSCWRPAAQRKASRSAGVPSKPRAACWRGRPCWVAICLLCYLRCSWGAAIHVVGRGLGLGPERGSGRGAPGGDLV